MKLERLPEYTTIVVTIFCGMLLALYVGVSAGTGSRTPVILLAGFLAMAVALTLKEKIWLLIPISSTFTGTVAGSSFNLSHLSIFYVFSVYLTLRALKIVRSKASYGWLDYLLFANLAYLAVTYLRNPVGTNSTGFEKIGGRPYVEIIFMLLAYYVLGLVKISPKLAMRLPLLMILGSTFNTLAGAVGAFFPSVGMKLYSIYSAFAPPQSVVLGTADPNGVNRETYMASGGSKIFQALCSYFPPLSLLNPIHLFRFAITLLALIAILKSGFRSILFDAFIFAVIATYFRSGAASVIRIAALAGSIIIIAVMGQGTLFNLPLNMQRSLSFLPGRWDSSSVQDAKGSTEWRHEIWDNVRRSGNKYINNWWFGDGFGMTREQLRESQMITSDSQENLTIAGDYHSLPLSTIHVVGYVGLVLLMIQLIGQSFYAYKLVARSRRTPFFALALFVAAPQVYLPVTSILIFGAFNLTAPGNVIAVAWMRLISRSLEAYLEEKKQSASTRPAPLPDFEFAPQFLKASITKGSL
ncbi:MAG: hypothetical protein ACFUZC_19015 [Chthoniobacteraceae bacterium]